jgi:hypothetical protein
MHLQNSVPPEQALGAHLQQVRLPPQQQQLGNCQHSSVAPAAAAAAGPHPPLPPAATAAAGPQPPPAAGAAAAGGVQPPPAAAAAVAGPQLPPPPVAAAGTTGCGAGAAGRRKLPSSLTAQRSSGPSSGGRSSMPGSCGGGSSGGGYSGGGGSGGCSGGGGSGGGGCVQQWGGGQQQHGAIVRGPKQLPWAGRVRYACTAADVDAACRWVGGLGVVWSPGAPCYPWNELSTLFRIASTAPALHAVHLSVTHTVFDRAL